MSTWEDRLDEEGLNAGEYPGCCDGKGWFLAEAYGTGEQGWGRLPDDTVREGVCGYIQIQRCDECGHSASPWGISDDRAAAVIALREDGIFSPEDHPDLQRALLEEWAKPFSGWPRSSSMTGGYKQAIERMKQGGKSPPAMPSQEQLYVGIQFLRRELFNEARGDVPEFVEKADTKSIIESLTKILEPWDLRPKGED